MKSLGVTLLKITALAGGAILGAILDNWIEEALSRRSEERSDHDRLRYAQGLSPIEPQRVVIELPPKEEEE